MSNGLAGATSLIGTAVGLGVTVGALGLAFNFANRAIESTSPRPRRSKKGVRRQSSNLFDFGSDLGMGGKRRSRQPDIFGGNLF